MPQFRFNVSEGDVASKSMRRELADIRQARVEAIGILERSLDQSRDKQSIDPDIRIEVTDQAGLVLFTLELATTEVLALAG